MGFMSEEKEKTEAKPGDWVQIKSVLLGSCQRPKHLPEETRKVPLEMVLKGFSQDIGKMEDEITVKTVTGRKVSGKLMEINPSHTHSFGPFPPELLDESIKLKISLKNIQNSEGINN